jgi:GTP cyclohydrolase I
VTTEYQDLDKYAPEALFDAVLRAVCPETYNPEEDEHTARTAWRFVKMLRELTDGREDFTFTTFVAHSQEMVIVKNIRFVSVCMHHVAPFFGVCHIGYVPDKHMAGISKFSRHVRLYARTLTVQEVLTSNIANSLTDILEPRGVAVVMNATHSCMSTRGALAHGTETITSAMRGVFIDHTKTAKAEFMQLITMKE